MLFPYCEPAANLVFTIINVLILSSIRVERLVTWTNFALIFPAVRIVVSA